MRRGGGASWKEAMLLARGVKACFAFIKRLGYTPYPPGKMRLDASPAWVVAAMLWFLSRIPSFRELLSTGEAAAVRANESPLIADRMRAMKPQVPAVGERRPPG